MNRSNTVGEVLRKGKARLKETGKENYAFEAEILLAEATGLKHVDLFARGGKFLMNEEIAKYQGFLAERERNRPLQYIIGRCEFMGLEFSVGEGVLIPRADTETLVETVLEISKLERLYSIIDIGTGSGCIPISLVHYRDMEAVGLDISAEAVAFARKNAEKNGVSVQFLESDLFSALEEESMGNWDAVVSNPPYIARDVIPGLMPEVRDFEPMGALDGGTDGLDFYRKIIDQSRKWLKDGGWLFFEIGYDQGAAVCGLMEKAGYVKCAVEQDLARLDRVVYGKWKKR